MLAVPVSYPDELRFCAEARAVPVSKAADQGLACVRAWAHADRAEWEACYSLTGDHAHLILSCVSQLIEYIFTLPAARLSVSHQERLQLQPRKEVDARRLRGQ